MQIKLPDGKGFDIVVWQKPRVGEVFCTAYTFAGKIYMGEWFTAPETHIPYEMGAIHPREFIGKAPKDLKIGGVSPGAKKPMLINPPLH